MEIKVPVKKLMSVTPTDLRTRLRTNITVVFDDGVEAPMTYREVIVNRYVWKLLELYKDLPVLSSYNIQTNYVAGMYVSSTLMNTFETMVKYIVDHVLKPGLSNGRGDLATIWYTIQNIFNDIYNDVVFNNLDYVTSLDLSEFLDIQFDPRLIDSMRKIANSEQSMGIEIPKLIDNCYRTLAEVIADPKFENNKLANGYKSKTMRRNQLEQVLGAKGRISNLTNEVYQKPIASSFTTGLYSIDDLAMESQTGAKALLVSTNAIRQSELFARMLQLVMARVERVAEGDCGQTDYVEWYVEPESKDPDNPKKCMLPMLIGKYYYNEETKQEELITKDHTHLIGTKIKLRVAYKCKWSDPRCICSKCLGEISWNIPVHTHLGHFASTFMTQKITQSILSTKHHITSANTENISIQPPEANLDFDVKDDDNTLVYIKDKMVVNKAGGVKETVFNNKKDYDVFIKVAAKSAKGITDIGPNTDVRKFNPTSVSILREMYLVKVNKESGEVTETPVFITKNKGRKFGSFTTEFLIFIQQQNNYTIDSMDYITIPLEGWNYKQPIVYVPDVAFNFISYSKNISGLFGAAISNKTRGRTSTEDKADDKNDIYDIKTQDGFLYRLFTEVNTHFDINIAMFEVIVAGFSVKNYEEMDFSVAHGASTASTRNIKTIMSHTSNAGQWAYQEHLKLMLHPYSFDKSKAINHIMDCFVEAGKTLDSIIKNPIKLK